MDFYHNAKMDSSQPIFELVAFTKKFKLRWKAVTNPAAKRRSVYKKTDFGIIINEMSPRFDLSYLPASITDNRLKR